MKKLFALALIAAVLVGCQKSEPAQTDTGTATVSTAAPGDAEKTYTMNGKLVSRDAAKNEVTIDNEEVRGGVMAPMVMAYELRGAKVGELPPDGSRITSTLHEENGKYWVSDVKPAQ